MDGVGDPNEGVLETLQCYYQGYRLLVAIRGSGAPLTPWCNDASQITIGNLVKYSNKTCSCILEITFLTIILYSLSCMGEVGHVH